MTLLSILSEINSVQQVGRLAGRPEIIVVVTPTARRWLKEAARAKRCLWPIPAQGLGEFLPLSAEQQEIISDLGKGVRVILWPPQLGPLGTYILERHGRETLPPLMDIVRGYSRFWMVPETGESGSAPADLPGREWIEQRGLRQPLYAAYRCLNDQIRWWRWGRRTLREAQEWLAT